jgi:hypothetical protein
MTGRHEQNTWKIGSSTYSFEKCWILNRKRRRHTQMVMKTAKKEKKEEKTTEVSPKGIFWRRRVHKILQLGRGG